MHSRSRPRQHFPISKGPDPQVFFRQIIGKVDTTLVFINNLVCTVATYVHTSTVTTEKGVKVAVIFIRHSIFCADNIADIVFLDSKMKYVTINDPSCQPSDFYYFNFNSIIKYLIVDSRTPDAVHMFELSLHLPHTSRFSLSDPFGQSFSTNIFYS